MIYCSVALSIFTLQKNGSKTWEDKNYYTNDEIYIYIIIKLLYVVFLQ